MKKEPTISEHEVVHAALDYVKRIFDTPLEDLAREEIELSEDQKY